LIKYLRIKIKPAYDESSQPHDIAPEVIKNNFKEANGNLKEKSIESCVQIKIEPMDSDEDDRTVMNVPAKSKSFVVSAFTNPASSFNLLKKTNKRKLFFKLKEFLDIF
ncbi:hypothetical protein evm_014825, partial [Chilo suppressalis]